MTPTPDTSPVSASEATERQGLTSIEQIRVTLSIADTLCSEYLNEDVEALLTDRDTLLADLAASKAEVERSRKAVRTALLRCKISGCHSAYAATAALNPNPDQQKGGA